MFRVAVDLCVTGFDQLQGFRCVRVDGFHEIVLDLLGDQLRDALLFVEPIEKPGLDGKDATIVDVLVWTTVLADLLVVAGAPALQVEDRYVVVTNRGLRLCLGSHEFHVPAIGLSGGGAWPNVVVAAEFALFGTRARTSSRGLREDK